MNFYMGVVSNVVTDLGESPLIVAARNELRDMISCLLSAGADVSFKNKDGRSALSWAEMNSDKATINILKQHGAT